MVTSDNGSVNDCAMMLDDDMCPQDDATGTASLMADLSGQARVAHGKGRHAY
jgi:hypothetical protein